MGLAAAKRCTESIIVLSYANGKGRSLLLFDALSRVSFFLSFFFIPMPISRLPSPSKSPVSRAVRITSPQEIIVFSAQYPEVVDAQADPRSVAAFGDTATQTRTTLERVASALEEVGMTTANLVSMRVYLVADPGRDGGMDFDGFNEACKAFFQSDEDKLPARTVLQAAGLVNPGWLVEIEIVAAR